MFKSPNIRHLPELHRRAQRWIIPRSDVTVGITGNSITAAVGAVGIVLAVAGTGNVTAAATSNVTPATSVSITGNAAAGQAGTVSTSGPVVRVPQRLRRHKRPNLYTFNRRSLFPRHHRTREAVDYDVVTVAIVGNAITSGLGTVSVGGNVTVSITGNQASVNAGTVGTGAVVSKPQRLRRHRRPNLYTFNRRSLYPRHHRTREAVDYDIVTVAIVGNRIIPAAGNVAGSVSGGGTVAITGNSITTAAGNVTVSGGSVNVSITGNQITSAAGNVTVSGAIDIIEQWLNDPAAQRVVLAEAYPEEPLFGFTRLSTMRTAPPRYVGKHSFSGGGVSSVTISPSIAETIAYTDRILVVRVAFLGSGSGQQILGVTAGGVALIKVDNQRDAALNLDVGIWYLINPPMLDGSWPLVISGSSTGTFIGSAALYVGVNGTTPFGTASKATATSTAPSISPATGGVNELVVDMVATNGAAYSAVGAGQTVRQDDTVGALHGFGSDEVGTGSPVTMSWTLASSVPWCSVGASLKPAQSRAYTLPLSDVVESDVVPGGMFAEVLDIVYNGLVPEFAFGSGTLSQAADLAALEYSTGSSYLYDGTTLWVQLVGGADPNMAEYIAAKRLVRLSTDAVNFTDQPLYYPLISGSIPELRDEADKLINSQAQITSGSLSALNGDKRWDRIGATWVWRNRICQFYFGGGPLAYNDYIDIGRILFVDAAPGDNHMVWRLRAYEPLDLAFPVTSWNEYWPDYYFSQGLISADLRGQDMPLVFGTVKRIPLIPFSELTWTLNRARWLISDPAYPITFNLTEVVARNKTTQQIVQVANTDYANAGNWLEVDVTAYPVAEWDIFASGSRNGTWRYGELTKELLLLSGVDAGDIDDASFAQASIDAPFDLGYYIPGGDFPSMMLSDIMQDLGQSVNGRIYYGRGSRWYAQIWSPGGDIANLPEIRDEDIDSWNPFVKVESVVKKVRIYYDESLLSESFKMAFAENNAVGWRNNTADSISYKTKLVNAADAEVVAGRYLLRLSQPSLTIQMTELGPKTVMLKAWDKLLLTRSRGPSATGSLNLSRFEVLSIIKHFTPKLSVELTVDDLSGLGESVRAWAPDTVTAMATSTDLERKTYGAWLDDTASVPGVDATPSRWY